MYYYSYSCYRCIIIFTIVIMIRLDKYALNCAAMARKSIALIPTEQQQSTSKNYIDP